MTSDEKTKKPKILVEVCKRHHSSNATHKFTGRLVGIISAEECQAIINTPGIARGIYSLPPLNLEEDVLVEPWRERKRFIMATDDFYHERVRAIFISPVITWGYESRSGATFSQRIICRDDYVYTLSTK